jgi:hypothetical protein
MHSGLRSQRGSGQLFAPNMQTHSSPLPPDAYPIATIAAYGPDDQRATKLVVAIFPTPGLSAPSVLQTWRGSHFDIREDPGTAAEVTQFVMAHGVKRVVSPETILGCPHDEGTDYPRGTACPHCAFWAGRQRAAEAVLRNPPPPVAVKPTPVKAEPKAGRNDPCPCGSGKKFKRCCAT